MSRGNMLENDIRFDELDVLARWSTNNFRAYRKLIELYITNRIQEILKSQQQQKNHYEIYTPETEQTIPMKNETTLAITGMSQAKFGKLLVDTAQEREKARFIKESTEQVQRLLSGIDKIKQCMERDKYMLEIYESRVQAIKDGKFYYSTSYQSNMQSLVYDEERLNENC